MTESLGSIDRQILESAMEQVKSEFVNLRQLPGDFWEVRTQVDGLTLARLQQDGLSVPVADSALQGRYKVDSMLRTTTSSAMACGDLVIKTLREPYWRVQESLNGKLFSDNHPHYLFPWELRGADGSHLGVVFQEACLLGELRAGVLYNSEHNPYYGLMAVRNGSEPGTVELMDRREISAEDNIWPALVMRKERLEFSVAEVLLEWQKGNLPELTEQNMVVLVTQSVLAYDKKGIPVSPQLKQRFGTVDFFRRCLVFETPASAAGMTENPFIRTDEVIKTAAAAAQEALVITDEFIATYPDYIEEEVREREIVGHADSKFSNTSIRVENREELIEVIKSGEIPFVILDAQSLAVNPGLMFGREGYDYAHWRIVPREQQWAYAFGQLLGMGLNRIRNAALERLKEASGMAGSWSQLDQAFYLLQEAYKAVGVEPFVNAFGWSALKPDGEPAAMLELTMKCYPQAGLEVARDVAEIVGLSWERICAKLK
jgi:hypothetical protein